MDLIFGRPDFADAARAQHNGFLLTNGLGGYSALSAAFSATRGDHALLMACTRAPPPGSTLSTAWAKRSRLAAACFPSLHKIKKTPLPRTAGGF